MTEAEVAVRDPREPSPIEGMITAYRDDFATLLPAHLPADKFVRWCLGYLRQFDGARREALLTSSGSVSALVGLMEGARLGLEFGPECHLIGPIKGLFTFAADYKGEIKLIGNAGGIVHADIIWSDDKILGHDETFEVVRDYKADSGEAWGAYAYATLLDGRRSRVVVMDRGEIDAHLEMSRSPEARGAFWRSWWLKACVHELSKWVPTSPEIGGRR